MTDNVSESSKKAKMGSFQTMGLDKDLLKGLSRMNYKTPTPVQRKALPIVLAGMDVVCMARTGSGKTCVFLLPLLQKLKCHDPKSGVRGLVLSPTRELAMQTFKFARDMGKFTDLRIISIVGGDGMEAQFESLSSRPDIIIATPGRLMHQLREISSFKLKSIKYLVFDEADRLFEMGFAEQLSEIIRECPQDRQTLLFSATLPKMLVQFTRAGLRDPQLIRLDTDVKMSEELRISFFTVRSTEKVAALLYLLRRIIPKDQLTIIFTATKHHSEFLYGVLEAVGISSTLVYGSMDQDARTDNLRKFRNGEVSCMIVTDLAARGIDVPLLNNVINFHFPCTPKLFVHRCGRAARQGRIGYAMSIIEPEELAYLADIHAFIGKPISNEFQSNTSGDGVSSSATSSDNNNNTSWGASGSSSKSRNDNYNLSNMSPEYLHTGILPTDVLDSENEYVKQLLAENSTLNALWRVCENAMIQYRRTRPEATHDGVRTAKKLIKSSYISAIHPLIAGEDPEHCDAAVIEKAAFVKHLQSFRPSQTVLETGIGTGAATKRVKKTEDLTQSGIRDTHGGAVMKALRLAVAQNLERNRPKIEDVMEVEEDVEQVERDEWELAMTTGDGDEGPETDEYPLGLEDREEEENEDGVGGDANLQSEYKPRLSKFERRKQLKRKRSTADTSTTSNGSNRQTFHPENSTTASYDGMDGVTVREMLTESSSKSLSGSFKDPKFYMSYGNEDVAGVYAEDSMQPQSGVRGNELRAVKDLERALLDVAPDDAIEMNKKRRMMRWDAKKRKFVKQSLEEMTASKGAKRVRSESGVTGGKSTAPAGELYKKWKAKTHREINTTAEANEGGGDEDYRESGGYKNNNNKDTRRPNMKVNRNVKDEIRSADEIRKIQKKRDSNKLKNMSKDKRKQVLSKIKKTNKVQQQDRMSSMNRGNKRSKVIVRY